MQVRAEAALRAAQTGGHQALGDRIGIMSKELDRRQAEIATKDAEIQRMTAAATEAFAAAGSETDRLTAEKDSVNALLASFRVEAQEFKDKVATEVRNLTKEILNLKANEQIWKSNATRSVQQIGRAHV